jgi:hypothetical protein
LEASPNNRRRTGASGRLKLDPIRQSNAVRRRLQRDGFAIWPSPPGAKFGRPGWAEKASRDPKVLDTFGPDDGTMAHMGLSGMFTLDLDRHSEDADGVENFKAFVRTSGLKFTDTRIQATPNDGLHVEYLQNPVCLLTTSHSRLAAGVDILAGTALVMMHPTPGYMTLRERPVAMIPLATAQELARLTMTEPKRARTDGVTGTQVHSIGGLTMTLANAQQGTRNDVLHWSLCRAAEMPYGKQRSALRALRREARMIGLGDFEIEKTIASVFGGNRG